MIINYLKEIYYERIWRKDPTSIGRVQQQS